MGQSRTSGTGTATGAYGNMASLSTDVHESISEANANQWNNLVSQSDRGTVFHRTGWLRAIEEGLDRRARHVVVEKGGNPVAVCPNFVTPVDVPFDLPASPTAVGLTQLSSVTPGFGGPLILADKADSLERIFERTAELCRFGPVVHRLRVLDPGHVQYAQALREQGYQPSLLYCRFFLRLDDYDRIWEAMDGERRKEIRNADTEAVSVRRTDADRDSLRRFHADYERAMARIDGTTFPRPFFDALAAHLDERLELFTAYREGDPIGAHLYLRDDEQDSLHYFFSGVPGEYFKYSAPSLIHDRAIKWGLENGYATYDFGATSSDYGDGTFNYKKKFGAALEPVYEWENGHAPLRWRLYRAGRRLYLRNRS